ncbi:hypothetical protein KPL42_13220 [Clostridium gasigenes]|uniref:hypothetical protein n=1 Tax=Clostridium gasigenes TaxID=94869 RepID=UPI001C0AB0E4|nr:hypothetical protein [Clostridium gasigenes]MBU3089452.1 hypothetical protein [Clostridium gasigenes]
MNKRNDSIIKWAINRIENNYKDDVSLLLSYGSYVNGTANSLSDVDFYFIPKTERAYGLCTTFIVESVGFDLFPMSWERVEGLAELQECLTPLLANVNILYCNSLEDKHRFEELQNKLNKNMNNKDFMLEKASKELDSSISLYETIMFEDSMCDIRTLAGKIAMSLSNVVAYINQTYFIFGLKKQMEDLKNFKSVPDDFILMYESIVESNSEQEIKNYCYKMIQNTRIFLNSKIENPKENEKKANYEDLAELYKEIISQWNKIYVSCDSGDYVLAYISGTCLQDELNAASIENGLNKFDLMSSYNAKELNKFKERAIQLQKDFVKVIEDNGVIIESYTTVDEFINKN